VPKREEGHKKTGTLVPKVFVVLYCIPPTGDQRS